MTEEFVSYELAVKLKELGFDEKCLMFYTKSGSPSYLATFKKEDLIEEVLAPLWQQAFHFFRDKHRLDFKIDYQYDTDRKLGYKPQYFIDIHEVADTSKILFNQKRFSIIRHESFKTYKTYEEARQACLEKLIEIVS